MKAEGSRITAHFKDSRPAAGRTALHGRTGRGYLFRRARPKTGPHPGTIGPCLRAWFVYYPLMATVTLTVTTDVHDKLKRLKIGKDSFSDMLARELPDRANTCGEALEKLEGRQLPPMDPALLKAVRSGRGRRSNRILRHAR